MTKVLNVRFFSQLDNVYHPEGTCNLTSAAMCLYFHGVRPKNKRMQLEDELFEYVHHNKLSRHSAQDIATVIRAFGCSDKLTWDTTIEEVKQSIDKGNPCILHGMFTRSGHIIVARGYNEAGLIVNDPYGEFLPHGLRYQRLRRRSLLFSRTYPRNLRLRRRVLGSLGF